MLTFEEINNDFEWDQYVQKGDNYSFLNSSARFRYSKQFFIDSKRFLIKNNNLDTIGVVSYSIKKSKLGNFLYAVNSPIFFYDVDITKENISNCCNFLKQKGRESGCFVAKMSPLWIQSNELNKLFNELGCKKAPTQSIDALITQQIDLTQPIEDILMQMHMSYRQNVKRCLKDPRFTVRIFEDLSQLDIYFNFHKQIRVLKNYIDKNEDAFRKEFDEYFRDKMFYTLVEYYDNTPIGAWIIIKYGKYIFNYQAAYDVRHRLRGASELLFFKSCELGKSLGCKILDLFGGIAPEGASSKHPWKGITMFKTGLGGKTVKFNHLVDIPINIPVYWIYYLLAYYNTVSRGYTVNW